MPTLSTRSPAGTPAPARAGRWQRREWLLAALLVALAVGTLYPALGCDFVNFDDHQYLLENRDLRAGLTPQGLGWGLTTFYFSNWHPLVWWSYLLDYQLYGLHPAGFHLTNLLWHLASTVVLFAALRRLTGATWPSFLAAALFAVHPLNVQSVAWVSERKGVISTFFWMLTLWAYARYAERPGGGRYLVVCASLALGLMAKQMLVTLPCVLLLLDYWPLRRLQAGTPAARLLAEKVPLFALAVGASLLTIAAQGHGGAITSTEVIAPGARLKNAVVSYLVYLGRAAVPVNLAPYYIHPGNALPLWEAAAAALALLAVTALALWQRRQRPYLLVGWLWYLGTLVPVIGLLQVGSQAQADRYAYVPLVGIYVAAAWGLAELARRAAWRRPVVVAAGAAVSALAVVSWVQVHYWQNSILLWENAIRARGGDTFSSMCLGLELMKIDRPAALHCFREAVRFNGTNYPAHFHLGVLLLQEQAQAEASRHFAEVIRLAPESPQAGDAHVKLGLILLERGALAEAGTHFDAAARLLPDDAEAQAALGIYGYRRGDPAGGDAHFRRALELEPDNGATYLSYGTALLERGRTEEAAAQFGAAARRDPEVTAAHLWNLGQVQRASGKAAAALVCLRCLADLRAGSAAEPQALDALAAAYAEAGRAADALTTARRATAAARATGQAGLADQLEQRLRRYQQAPPSP